MPRRAGTEKKRILSKAHLGGGLDGADACVALDGQLEVGQRQPLEGDQLPGDRGVGTLNESLHSQKKKKKVTVKRRDRRHEPM